MRQPRQALAAALRRRGDLLVLLSLLVALGVIGMHQLSDGHTLVTATGPATDHGHAERPGPAVHHHSEPAAEATATSQLKMTTGWLVDPPGAHCPDCHWQAMAEACVLALGLLSALATARPSARRLIFAAPRRRARQQARGPDQRVRGAMSLSELSIRRT